VSRRCTLDPSRCRVISVEYCITAWPDDCGLHREPGATCQCAHPASNTGGREVDQGNLAAPQPGCASHIQGRGKAETFPTEWTSSGRPTPGRFFRCETRASRAPIMALCGDVTELVTHPRVPISKSIWAHWQLAVGSWTRRYLALTSFQCALHSIPELGAFWNTGADDSLPSLPVRFSAPTAHHRIIVTRFFERVSKSSGRDPRATKRGPLAVPSWPLCHLRQGLPVSYDGPSAWKAAEPAWKGAILPLVLPRKM